MTWFLIFVAYVMTANYFFSYGISVGRRRERALTTGEDQEDRS